MFSRRTVLITLGLLILCLLGAGAWAGHILTRTSEKPLGGQSRPSPDRKYVAYATTVTEGAVLGKKRRYSELRIDMPAPSSQTVRRMVIEDTAEPAMDWRIEGEVFWTKNSSSVTFKCVTGKANLEITLTP
jgi:hypothetical protein